jgi:hypothetical protein
MSRLLGIQLKDEERGCCDPLGSKKDEEDAFQEDNADLVKEMNALTLFKREKIFEDVHGVADIQEETPEFVEDRIEALDKLVNLIPQKDRTAYDKAIFLKPKLQTDVKFKLKFLRAEEFNTEKAATRMVKFFDLQLSLFGEDKLVKRLTMDDLSEDEIRFYKIGYMGELPFRDRSGRPIIFGDGSKRDCETMAVDDIVSKMSDVSKEWFFLIKTQNPYSP